MPRFDNLTYDEEQYINSMVFNLGTQNLTDFPVYDLKGGPFEEFKSRVKTEKVRPPPAVFVDINSLQPFKKAIPFNLLHKPKEIIRQLPCEKQEKFERVTDYDREEVQKSRPRLVMTPQLSMDDIEDQQTRALLCNDVYLSTYMSQCRDIPVPKVKVAAPLQDLPSPGQPIFLPALRPPELPEAWRERALAWDNNQLRYTLDLEKRFWTESDIYAKCTACKQTAQAKKRNSMLKNHMT